jgi:hypothetical protein
MGIPKKEVFPNGIKRRRHPVVARSHFKSLDKIIIRAQDSSNIPQGINAGTSRFREKTNSGILRRINAGKERYITNRFNTFPVSPEKAGMRFNAIPMSRNVIVITKLSIIQIFA